MGLSDWLADRAVRATHVLVVECPGGWALRAAVERSVTQRGWRLAEAPATADALIVVGRPTGELAEVVERLWEAMPGPRSRAEVLTRGDVPTALDSAARHLTDWLAQTEDAASRTRPGPSDDGEPASDEDMGHDGHEGMDHGDMDMAPDGIPLAGGSEDDRDGLEMDVLPVRLGPVLPSWPAGLVLDVTLHGDLVTGATARLLGDGDPEPTGDDAPAAARACADVAAVLDLAGWPDGAARARATRDAFLDRDDEHAGVALADLSRRVAASRLLAWSLRGVGVVNADTARELGLHGHLAGDCLDRVHGHLVRASNGSPAAVPLSAVGHLITGCDLAVARLVVASLGSSFTTAQVRSRA